MLRPENNIRFALLAIVALFYCEPSHAFVSLMVVTKKMTINSNGKYTNVTHTVHQIGPKANHSTDIAWESFRQLKDMKLTASFYVVRMNRRAQNPLISRNVDLCTFINRPSLDRFIDNIYQHLLKNSHTPTSCPIPAGRYYVNGFRPQDIRVPGFLPECEFLFTLVFETGPQRELVADIRFLGKLVRVMNGAE